MLHKRVLVAACFACRSHGRQGVYSRARSCGSRLLSLTDSLCFRHHAAAKRELESLKALLLTVRGFSTAPRVIGKLRLSGLRLKSDATGQPDVLRIAAFAKDGTGGNPAGVCIQDELPEEADMQLIASDMGFSETAFAAKSGDRWKVRYFSPESEVPFCGHATIALGAALAMKHGNGIFNLSLQAADITVEGSRLGSSFAGALQSPSTTSLSVSEPFLTECMSLFGFTESDLDSRIPPAIVEGGNKHLVLGLRDRSTLAGMKYDMANGRKLMKSQSLVTIILVFAESEQLFHVRNAFASGGVYEDPATGSAAAAFGGYLRDLEWPHGGEITIMQGEDMGMPSQITATIPSERGASIRVSGIARLMEE